MFTIEQIKTAHSKVKSGADFPLYIREIKQLGVIYYETFVINGQSDYFGKEELSVSTGGKYSDLQIANESDKNQFLLDLKAHQQGKTDYPTFCQDCAKSGVEKWVIDLHKMTCIYYDLEGNEMVLESIPSVE